MSISVGITANVLLFSFIAAIWASISAPIANPEIISTPFFARCEENSLVLSARVLLIFLEPTTAQDNKEQSGKLPL